MNYNSLEISKFKITEDHSFQDKRFHITPEIKRILQKIHPKVQKGTPSIIKKLQEYCRRYPRVPQFKNFLGAAYESAGFFEKMVECNKQTIEEHPDYLFGKLTYAGLLIKEDEPEKVPDILGEKLDLQSLYPDRDTFHLREVLGFFKICVQYYLAKDKQENVLPYLEIMNEIGPDEPETEFVQNIWLKHTMKGVSRRLEEENERRRSVESHSYDKGVQTDQEPVFNHTEIEALYSHDVRIDHGIIREILELPRETLIKDLEEVVEDSILRFEYFRERNNQYDEWHDKEFSFILHALFLLAELESVESLSVIFHLLRQGKELLEFWFFDALTHMISEVLYHLIQHQLDESQAFMREPDNYTYARCAVKTAVAQIALHQPTRRDEVVEWFKDLFQFFLENSDNDRIIDTDLISLMICNVIDFRATELQEIIRELYGHNLVEKSIVGTIDEVLRDMTSGQYQPDKHEIFDIYSRYNYLAKAWYPEQESNKSTFDAALQGNLGDKQHSQNQPVQVSKKVSRNDPCSCGSGKKYKYCCMK